MHTEDKIQEILVTQMRMEAQLGRLISDYESEKDTRKRRNESIDKRIADLEKWQAKWGGALITLGIIATIVSIAAMVIKLK